GGRPVIARTLELFAGRNDVGRIVVAIHRDDAELFAEAGGELAGRVETVTGGASRQESTLLALKALAENPPKTVLIHDAVRPFVDEATIGRVIAAARAGRAALPATPVTDTLKRRGAEG